MIHYSSFCSVFCLKHTRMNTTKPKVTNHICYAENLLSALWSPSWRCGDLCLGSSTKMNSMLPGKQQVLETVMNCSISTLQAQQFALPKHGVSFPPHHSPPCSPNTFLLITHAVAASYDHLVCHNDFLHLFKEQGTFFSSLYLLISIKFTDRFPRENFLLNLGK